MPAVARLREPPSDDAERERPPVEDLLRVAPLPLRGVDDEPDPSDDPDDADDERRRRSWPVDDEDDDGVDDDELR